MAIDIDGLVELFDRVEDEDLKRRRRLRRDDKREEADMGRVLPFRRPRRKGSNVVPFPLARCGGDGDRAA